MFKSKELNSRYFVFTDRPLYRPGDEIFFKAILREEDDVRYSIPDGKALVEVYTGWGDQKVTIFENKYEISSYLLFQNREYRKSYSNN